MNSNVMRATGFKTEMELVERGACPFCLQPVKVSDFRTVLDVKEYRISGLCQGCQDRVFVVDSTEE